MDEAAYEMRISDWSSDVCSSDLRHDDVFTGIDRQPGREGGIVTLGADIAGGERAAAAQPLPRTHRRVGSVGPMDRGDEDPDIGAEENRRASWWEEGCRSLERSGGAVSLQKKKKRGEDRND